MQTTCHQKQCRSKTVKTLHAGYVRHRNLGEEPCDASRAGHNEYVRNQISTKTKENTKP